MARRFRFRLDTILRVRKEARDAGLRALADRTRAVQKVEERLAGLEVQLQQTQAQVRDACGHRGLDVVTLRRHHVFCAWLKRNLEAANLELVERKKELEEQRLQLAAASKRLKVLEQLRHRKWQQHEVAMAREEQAVADEAAVQCFLRSGTEVALLGIP